MKHRDETRDVSSASIEHVFPMDKAERVVKMLGKLSPFKHIPGITDYSVLKVKSSTPDAL